MLVVCMSGFFGLFVVGEFSSAIWGCFGKISFGNRVPFCTKIPKSIFQRGPKPCAPEVA